MSSVHPEAMPEVKRHKLLAYVADLELEVDRLRKQIEFIHYEAGETLRRIRPQSTPHASSPGALNSLAEIEQAATHLEDVLRDLRESPGYYPVDDQVVVIAARPFIEQVFRWQQRLRNNWRVKLRLDLNCEHLDWFPTRLRHILENLLSNALKYSDPAKGETRVMVALRALPNGYELRVSDNGLGVPTEPIELVELFQGSDPARSAHLGVGLPVVKLLVEQSGGTLTTISGDEGTSFVVFLPGYDLADFLT